MPGKVVLVTGASRGIGKCIAKMLAAEGMTTAINYNTGENEALKLQKEIEDSGGRAFAVKGDTGFAGDVETVVNEVIMRAGRIDVLVNNAGICPFRDFFDITEEIWDKTFNINLKGYFLLSQRVAREMVKYKLQGKIINISSISGLVGSSTQVHYCSTKGGVNMLTKAMAVALGPYGIAVNAVLPGTIPTDANTEQLSDVEVQNKILKHTPFKNFGMPEDAAGMVKYLAGDECKWITGSLFVVDGGYTA